MPFGYVCLIAFAIGIGLILASMMVYFRDTQFLYGIVTVLWMYLTPLFYPIDIVPARFLPIIKCNPMFHFIRYVRNIIFGCFASDASCTFGLSAFAFGTLGIGWAIFQKAKKTLF